MTLEQAAKIAETETGVSLEEYRAAKKATTSQTVFAWIYTILACHLGRHRVVDIAEYINRDRTSLSYYLHKYMPPTYYYHVWKKLQLILLNRGVVVNTLFELHELNKPGKAIRSVNQSAKKEIQELKEHNAELLNKLSEYETKAWLQDKSVDALRMRELMNSMDKQTLEKTIKQAETNLKLQQSRA